jgi:hypothetical protein
MDEQSTPAVPPVSVAERDDLASMDAGALTSYFAAANTAMKAAMDAMDTASDALGSALTEQIARRVVADFPTATVLVGRYASEFCDNGDGEPHEDCDGHGEQLVPVSVLDADGEECGTVDPLSPVMFWMELLTPVLNGDDEMILELATRDWYGACDGDDECDHDGHMGGGTE